MHFLRDCKRFGSADDVAIISTKHFTHLTQNLLAVRVLLMVY